MNVFSICYETTLDIITIYCNNIISVIIVLKIIINEIIIVLCVDNLFMKKSIFKIISSNMKCVTEN